MIITTKTRQRDYVYNRQNIMSFLRIYTNLSYSKIGDLFKKDHASVIYNCKTFFKELVLYHQIDKFDEFCEFANLKPLLSHIDIKKLAKKLSMSNEKNFINFYINKHLKNIKNESNIKKIDH
jgi:hypothetical protein